MNLLKYTSIIILVAFVKLSVQILLTESHRILNWKSLRYFITTSHNRNIEVHSSRVESVDPLCHQTPRISLSFCSAMLKKLVLVLHCYIMDAAAPSVTSSHEAGATSIREAGAAICPPYLSPFIQKEYFSRSPSMIPFICHWPVLVHMVSLGWKEIRKVHTWYFHPLS